MERKGDLLNQLAIITDLIEKINTETISSTIIMELSNEEFDKVFDYLEKKNSQTQKKTKRPTNTFTISLGQSDIIFNRSNV